MSVEFVLNLWCEYQGYYVHHLSSGIQDDPDVKLMIAGSTLRKVKSRSWKKQRHFRLLEDGLTIWYKSRWAGKGHSTCECRYIWLHKSFILDVRFSGFANEKCQHIDNAAFLQHYSESLLHDSVLAISSLLLYILFSMEAKLALKQPWKKLWQNIFLKWAAFPPRLHREHFSYYFTYPKPHGSKLILHLKLNHMHKSGSWKRTVAGNML